MLRSLTFAAILFAASAALAQGARQNQSQAMVVVVDDGGLDVGTARAIRSVAMGAVRRHGISVSEDPRTEGIHSVDAALAKLAHDDLGVQRVFAVRIGGRLGRKILLGAAELSGTSLTEIYSASLTASSLDESDTVMSRIIDSVIDRAPVEDNAGMTTVTAQESQRFKKKPGERFFELGLPVAFFKGGGTGGPYGFSLGYEYEAQFFRLGATLETAARAGQGLGFFGFDVDWLPVDGMVSPYLGGGIGYVGANNTGGMGAKVEVGAEFFRLYGVRVLAGVEAVIPFFTGGYDSSSSTQDRPVFVLGHLRFAF